MVLIKAVLLIITGIFWGWTKAQVLLPLAARTVNLTCQQEEIILLPERDRIHQFSSESSCRLTNRLFTLPVQCSGRSSCSISPQLPRRCGNEEQLSINHMCIPVSEVNSVCGDEVLHSPTGYISSPRFPLPYPPNKLCTWRLTLTPGEKVKVTVFDLDLQVSHNATVCRDFLEVHVSHDRSYLYECGEMRQVKEVTLTESMTINFRSDEYASARGFLLQYRVYNPDEDLDFVESRTIQIPVATARPDLPYRRARPTVESLHPIQGDSNTVQKSSEIDEPRKIQEDDEASGGLIAGIIIGALLLLLIICLIIVFAIFFMKKKRSNKEEEKLRIKDGSTHGSTKIEEKDTTFTEIPLDKSFQRYNDRHNGGHRNNSFENGGFKAENGGVYDGT